MKRSREIHLKFVKAEKKSVQISAFVPDGAARTFSDVLASKTDYETFFLISNTFLNIIIEWLKIIDSNNIKKQYFNHVFFISNWVSETDSDFRSFHILQSLSFIFTNPKVEI